VLGSNLVLVGKQARVSAPECGADALQNQWAAAAAAHEMAPKNSKCLIMEREYETDSNRGGKADSVGSAWG
jgi:hypothetical protein